MRIREQKNVIIASKILLDAGSFFEKSATGLTSFFNSLIKIGEQTQIFFCSSCLKISFNLMNTDGNFSLHYIYLNIPDFLGLKGSCLLHAEDFLAFRKDTVELIWRRVVL